MPCISDEEERRRGAVEAQKKRRSLFTGAENVRKTFHLRLQVSSLGSAPSAWHRVCVWYDLWYVRQHPSPRSQTSVDICKNNSSSLCHRFVPEACIVLFSVKNSGKLTGNVAPGNSSCASEAGQTQRGRLSLMCAHEDRIQVSLRLWRFIPTLVPSTLYWIPLEETGEEPTLPSSSLQYKARLETEREREKTTFYR